MLLCNLGQICIQGPGCLVLMKFALNNECFKLHGCTGHSITWYCFRSLNKTVTLAHPKQPLNNECPTCMYWVHVHQVSDFQPGNMDPNFQKRHYEVGTSHDSGSRDSHFQVLSLELTKTGRTGIMRWRWHGTARVGMRATTWHHQNIIRASSSIASNFWPRATQALSSWLYRASPGSS